MNYEEFVSAVADCVKKRLDKEVDVLIHKVTKNNGVILDGLVIMEPERKYSPTIYLNSYFDRYMHGMPMEEIAASVYKCYLENVDKLRLPGDFFMNYEELSDRIAFRLVNYERNEELLSKIPHRRWKDLAIIYFVVFDDMDVERAVVTIYNNHLEMWNVTEESLYKNAKKNTPKLYPAEIKDMGEIMEEIFRQRMEEEELAETLASMETSMNMYVLTNSYKNFGATTMLYDRVLSRLSNELGNDLYIIPSSVHEVIIIPSEDSINRENLIQMVDYVNNTEVPREDVLSYNIYVYRREGGFE